LVGEHQPGRAGSDDEDLRIRLYTRTHLSCETFIQPEATTSSALV
jgi:hypothetical protein